MAKKEKSTQASRQILKLFSRADICCTQLQLIDKKLLSMLLLDRTTGRNIIWGCKEYEDLGDGFAEKDEMTV
ncbi:MAG: hypothetical protein HUJ99_00820, partial [Bacteroidaceae bacterium]|nr:hypothetical protein [Bacteroidaceae bacterium]